MHNIVTDDSNSDQFKTSDTSNNKNRMSVPVNALIRGLYQGSIPIELSDLNWYERSMISIYSCISRVKVLSGKHYKKCGTAYTIVNDLVKVTEFFPRMLNFDELAILRHKNETTTRDYKFNPKKVWRALQWLYKNNHLYKDIKFASDEVWPPKWRKLSSVGCELSSDLVDVPYIELTDEEVSELDTEYEAAIVSEPIDGSTSTELFEFQQEKEVFLYSEQDIRTHEENLATVLSSSSFPFNTATTLRTNILNVTSNHAFVNPYHDPLFFWAKCFPWLYPYGYGCPSDKNSSLQNLGAHTKQMLMRGGGPQGRRFQQCPSYYFAAYHYESRRKISGVTSKAQNSKYDELSDDDDIFTTAVLSRMISYSQEATKSEALPLPTPTESASSSIDITVNSLLASSVADQLNEINSDETTTNSLLPKMTKEEFEFYSKRLAVYGKSLPGTAMHMQNERNNLMSMLASPSVEEDGIWRWFLTFSPADLFDPRLYEVLAASDEEFPNWEERKIRAREMPMNQRSEILSLHPALAARLFELQQKDVWDFILGKSLVIMIHT